MAAMFRLYGMLLVGLSLGMLFPLMVELEAHTQDWEVFGASAFTTMFTGMILYIVNYGRITIDKRHVFLFTTSVWLIIPIFAALPFLFTSSSYHLNFSDAVFEAVSALTTTGSTVMTGLDNAPRGILLWRSLLEWMGGIGIVVLAMAILPQLGVGGMQLFRSESSDKSDKLFPRTRQVAMATFTVYLTLTMICAVAYYVAGMNGFDAINHAMTTLSTGGFSTHDASMAYFDDAKIEVVGTVFMLLGGIPMILYFALFVGIKPNAILVSQTKTYLLVSLIIIAATTWWLVGHSQYGVMDAMRYSAFNIISVITTTGFASADYTQWGGAFIIMIYFLTIIGGCTGSTSGGMKIFRFEVMYGALRRDFMAFVQPHGVFRTTIAGRPVGQDIEISVKIFFVLFALTFSFIAMTLSLLGLDFITSMSAAATAIANVGPGLGDVIGPTGNFASLPDMAKWVLAIGMIVGRLEILTVLVVLSPYFWKELK